jgi:hypothetical protein
MNVATVALAVSVILLLSGTMVLCHCPWWYAIAGLFACLAMPGGTRNARVFAAIVLMAAMGLAVTEGIALRNQKAAVMGQRARQKASEAGNNDTGELLSGRKEPTAR